ncbi:hypothetical protein VCV18_008989 [Metarhizium anisopliae]
MSYPTSKDCPDLQTADGHAVGINYPGGDYIDKTTNQRINTSETHTVPKPSSTADTTSNPSPSFGGGDDGSDLSNSGGGDDSDPSDFFDSVGEFIGDVAAALCIVM